MVERPILLAFREEIVEGLLTHISCVQAIELIAFLLLVVLQYLLSGKKACRHFYVAALHLVFCARFGVKDCCQRDFIAVEEPDALFKATVATKDSRPVSGVLHIGSRRKKLR